MEFISKINLLDDRHGYDSVLSVPGKPLFLYYKLSLITDLVFSLLASGSKLLHFDTQLHVA